MHVSQDLINNNYHLCKESALIQTTSSTYWRGRAFIVTVLDLQLRLALLLPSHRLTVK